MKEKYKSHDGHKNQKSNSSKKHPFYQERKVGAFFHEKSLDECIKCIEVNAL
jgi:hypothetical protein